MKLSLLIISFFISLHLTAAGEQLEQLYQTSLESLQNQEYQATITQAEELLKISKEQHDTWYIVQSYFILGYTHKKIENFGKAALCYLEGARFAEKSSEQRIKESLISIYNNLGMIMGNYKHFDLAHRFNQKGLEVARELSNEKHIIHLLQNDSYAYVEEGKYDSALRILQTIFNNHVPEFEREISLKNDLGLIYWNLGNADMAIAQYQYILNRRDAVKDTGLVAKVLHNLGLALMDQQEYTKAIGYLEEAAEINVEKEFTNNLLGNYKNIGRSWHQSGNMDNAIKYYFKAESLFNEAYTDPEDYDLFGLIANIYLSTNHPELAFQYEKLHIQHLQAFIAQQKEIEELDKKYNMELLTRRYFDLLEAEERHQQHVLSTWMGLGSATVVSLFMLFYVLYRQHRKKVEVIRALKLIDDASEV